MKRLVILGGGESGIGAALLGKLKKYNVFLSDSGKITNNYKDVLINNEIEWEDGGHTESEILTADLVVKSPGIPDHLTIVQKLQYATIPVVSEIEFAALNTTANIIGITGSNGKTTTTMMVYHILKYAGLDVAMGGNIGQSFAKQVLTKTANYVLELSSFQLDGIKNFRPNIAVITNITPDHLDRYDYKFENYIASKFRIIMNQTSDDYLLYDSDDEIITSYIKSHQIQSTLVPFSLSKIVTNGTYLEQNNIITEFNNRDVIMPISNLALEGKHNVKNAMAAATVAHLMKIRKATIRESLEGFQGAEHRLEQVLTINKVKYINDSKATNVNATYYALESMNVPTCC
jgi:UDP-N-acetylmuramoylalanine--D-glutamate ligase